MGTQGSPQRLRVGAELRRIREQLALSGDYVAAHLGWSQAKVSRIENGATAFTVRDINRLLDLYGVEADVKAELMASTAEDTGEGSWITQAGGWIRRQGAVASLESVTRRIRQYQPVVVPGLLQTREYARAIAMAAGVEDPDATAEIRMARQKVLDLTDAPSFEVVVDARALLYRAFPMRVLSGQIDHLVALVDHPNIDFYIVPLGVEQHSVAVMGFTIFEFKSKDSPPVVWIESPGGDVYFAETASRQRFESMFTAAKAIALHHADAVQYLVGLNARIDTLAKDRR